jgi:DNA-binding NarL/FixJ family response regulator
MALGKRSDLPEYLGENRGQDPTLSRPRLFILSNIRLLREGLTLAISHQPTVIVLGSSDISSSLTEIADLHPDVLLLDVARSGSLEICSPLRQILPDMKIVAFAVADVDREIIACAEAGVAGYVSGTGSAEDVVAAVHRAVRGELLCSPRTAALLFSRMALLSPKQGTAAGNNMLTRREHEIITLVEKGLSNKEIARLLRIESATVKNHVHSILTKLRLRRRGEAAAQIRRADAHRLDAEV